MRMLIGLTRRLIKFLDVNYINSNVSAANRIAHARCIFAVQLTDVVESGGVNQRNFPDVSKTGQLPTIGPYFSFPLRLMSLRCETSKLKILVLPRHPDRTEQHADSDRRFRPPDLRINSYVS